MTEVHFQLQIKRLKSQFSDTAFSNERLAMIWKDVRGCSEDWMTRTVDHFLAAERQAPLPADFKLALAQSSNADKGIRGTRGCSTCEGNGWTLPPYQVGRREVAMRCDCLGGYMAFANHIRNHPTRPDPELAADIEFTFRGMTPSHYRKAGFDRQESYTPAAPSRSFRSPDELLRSMPQTTNDDDDR